MNELYVILHGFAVTLALSFIGLVIGCVGGLVMGVAGARRLRTPILGRLISLYTFLIQGTPLYVQILLIYFALPQLWGGSISPVTAGIIALGCNSIAYVAQIVRAGINAIPVGQWEAAHVLGYRTEGALMHIILPQMLKNVLPALCNEMISLVKETSILGVIGVLELTKVTRDTVSRTMEPMQWYLIAAGLYLLATSLIAYGARHLEKRLQNDY